MIIQYLKRLSKPATLSIFCCLGSCESRDIERREFDTQKVLRAAKLSIGDSFEDPKFREVMLQNERKAHSITLSEFYQFAHSYGVPKPSDWEVVDGWHRPLRFAFGSDEATVWSIGPNAIDELGKGDDIEVKIYLNEQEFKGKEK